MKVTLEFIFDHVFLGRVEEDREWGRGGLHKSGTELGIFQESYPRRIFQSETNKKKE